MIEGVVGGSEISWGDGCGRGGMGGGCAVGVLCGVVRGGGGWGGV